MGVENYKFNSRPSEALCRRISNTRDTSDLLYYSPQYDNNTFTPLGLFG
ncbi:MAG: hypothetical protein K6E29_01855 [Cyanobacteria bacterium RUI128]|nr:hypothetical protein [Cyanobacteria bacterium RUI128]